MGRDPPVSNLGARPTSSVFASGQRLQIQTIGPGDSGDEIGGGFAGGVLLPPPTTAFAFSPSTAKSLRTRPVLSRGWSAFSKSAYFSSLIRIGLTGSLRVSGKGGG